MGNSILPADVRNSYSNAATSETFDRTYTVKKGDTLGEIAREHGVSLQDLLKANPDIKNPDKIKTNQQINLPEKAQRKETNTSEKPKLQAYSSAGALARRAEHSMGEITQKARLALKESRTEVQGKGAEAINTDPASVSSPGVKEVPDSKLTAPRSLEEQAKLYDQYMKHIPADKRETGTNEINIVGLRHHNIENKEGLRSYDDRFVALYKDKDGNKRAEVFEGATHPGQLTSKGAFTDVNEDGKADMAWIKPGTYGFHKGSNKHYGDVLRPDGKIEAFRDTNNDGKITGKELSEEFTASAILFHPGFDDRPKSAGCQTMAPDDFKRFMELVNLDPDKRKQLNYTLVDVSGR
jgi:LysM repeat protein